jgi:hypothetical protein
MTNHDQSFNTGSISIACHKLKAIRGKAIELQILSDEALCTLSQLALELKADSDECGPSCVARP